MNYSYNFPTGTNNGKISSAYNAVTGETITYQYDSLNRLASAAGSGWGDTYGFDGFGNLLTKTPTAGPAPTLSQAVNPANNQIVGQAYDANGNQSTAPNGLGQLGYDAENRLIENYATAQYAYDSQNKRVWKGTLASGTLTGQSASLYGIDGQKLGTYDLSVTSTQFTVTATSLSVYFAGKRVAIVAGGGNTPFVQDRLGSNMSGAQYPVSLYPWGEDRGTPAPNDQIKFATYTRDSSTLLDYADQRYYSNQFGRFATPDRGIGSSLTDPGSWNRYAYTRGDPVNRFDPHGTDDCSVVFADASQPYDPYSSCSGPVGCPGLDMLTAFEGDPDSPTFYAQAAAMGCLSNTPPVMPVAASSGPTIVCDLQLFVQPAGSNADPYLHTYIGLIVQVNGVNLPETYYEAGPIDKTTGGMGVSRTRGLTASTQLTLLHTPTTTRPRRCFGKPASVQRNARITGPSRRIQHDIRRGQ